MEQYPLINWIDGMKINKDFFIAMENAMIERINHSRAIQLNRMCYGLLPVSSAEIKRPDINLQLSSKNTILLRINELRAVTLGGVSIDIKESDNSVLELSYTLIEDLSVDRSFMIVLSVDPYSRVAIGSADPKEEPPRQPFVRNEYKLNLVPYANMNEDMYLGDFHLPIGKVDVLAGIPKLDNKYIPPCVGLTSHPDISAYHQECDKLLIDLEDYCITIINKIHMKRQKNQLAEIVFDLCNNILVYLTPSIPHIKRSMALASPVELIEVIAGLGRTVKGLIDTRHNCGKEELLNYFTDWCDLNQVRFETTVSTVTSQPYNHCNVAPAFRVGTDLIRLLTDLFSKLSELDYIGDQQDADVFVKEEDEDEKGRKKRRFFKSNN